LNEERIHCVDVLKRSASAKTTRVSGGKNNWVRKGGRRQERGWIGVLGEKRATNKKRAEKEIDCSRKKKSIRTDRTV